MSRLKDGDRFFFTHTNGGAKFNRNARQAIMERKLSDIICDNTAVKEVPTLAFLEGHDLDNPMKTCGEHNRLDIDSINLIDI